MSKKYRDSIVKLIDSHGAIEASKLIGLSITELIHQSGISFDNKTAYLILRNLINENKLPTNYKKFNIRFNPFDGISVWSYNNDKNINGVIVKEHITCFATPFWDYTNIIPVDFSNYSLETEDGEEIINLDFSDSYQKEIKTRDSFDSIEDLLLWYKNFYLPKVYEVIMEDILPLILNDYSTDIKSQI